MTSILRQKQLYQACFKGLGRAEREGDSRNKLDGVGNSVSSMRKR